MSTSQTAHVDPAVDISPRDVSAAAAAENSESELLNRINGTETQERDSIDSEASLHFFVAKLSSVSLLETVERRTVEACVEAETADIAAAAQESLEEARVLAQLTEELDALSTEDAELRALVESNEVLLAFAQKTSAAVAELRRTNDTQAAALAIVQEKLLATSARLADMPAAQLGEFASNVAALESIVLGSDGTSAEPLGESESRKSNASTTRPQLLAAWDATVESTQPAAAGSPSDEQLRSVSFKSFNARCAAAAVRHQQAVLMIDTLFQNHEAKLMSSVEDKEATLAQLQAAFDKEMKALEAPRRQLKQIEDEQHYHIRRGTFIKERSDRVSHDELVAERVKGKHNHLCSDLIKVQADINIVSNEVRDLRRSLEDAKRSTQIGADELLAKRKDLDGEAAALASMRQVLEAESDDLKHLKKDVSIVLQLVRLNNKTA